MIAAPPVSIAPTPAAAPVAPHRGAPAQIFNWASAAASNQGTVIKVSPAPDDAGSVLNISGAGTFNQWTLATTDPKNGKLAQDFLGKLQALEGLAGVEGSWDDGFATTWFEGSGDKATYWIGDKVPDAVTAAKTAGDAVVKAVMAA